MDFFIDVNVIMYYIFYFILSRSDVWKFKNSDFDFIRYQWMNWSGVDYCHVFKFELPFWRHPFTVEYPSIGEQVMYSIQFSFKEMLWVHYKSSSTSVAQSWSLQKTMVTHPLIKNTRQKMCSFSNTCSKSVESRNVKLKFFHWHKLFSNHTFIIWAVEIVCILVLLSCPVYFHYKNSFYHL